METLSLVRAFALATWLDVYIILFAFHLFFCLTFSLLFSPTFVFELPEVQPTLRVLTIIFGANTGALPRQDNGHSSQHGTQTSNENQHTQTQTHTHTDTHRHTQVHMRVTTTFPPSPPPTSQQAAQHNPPIELKPLNQPIADPGTPRG